MPEGYPKISIFIPTEYKCVVRKPIGQVAKMMIIMMMMMVIARDSGSERRG